MKDFFKRNILGLLLFILLLSTFSLKLYENNKIHNDSVDNYHKLEVACREEKAHESDICKNITYPDMLDAYTEYYQISNYEPVLMYTCMMMGVILILIVIINYNKKEDIKKNYNNIWIYPTYALISLLLCMLVTTNINFYYALDHNLATFNKELLEVFPIFTFTYLLGIFLVSIFYTNVAVIALKKTKNKVVAYALALTIVVCVELAFSYLLGGLFLERLLGFKDAFFTMNLMNFWNMDVNLIGFIIYYIFLAVASSLVLRHFMLKEKKPTKRSKKTKKA